MSSESDERVDEADAGEGVGLESGARDASCVGYDQHRRWYLLAAVAGLALVLLHAFGVGVDALHLLGLGATLNDQVVYVDAARHLLSSGEMTTGLIYPSTLLQDFGRNFLYMPGHAIAIAIAIAMFGDTPLSTIAPNLVAHVVCLVCLYFSGLRLVGAGAGCAAALAFAMTPIFLVYTWSAMAEMTTLAACLVAFTVFVHLRRPARPWLAPVLLIGPFLFRETAAFWIAPMVVSIFFDSQESRVRRWRDVAIAIVGSVLTLVFVYRLDWIASRPSLFAPNLLGQTFREKYTDAYATSQVDLDLATIVEATLGLAGRNLVGLLDLLTTLSFESITLHSLLWLPLAAAVLVWPTRRLRPLILCWASLFAVTFVFATLFYRWQSFIGVRQLLAPALLGFLVVGSALDAFRRSASSRSTAIFVGCVWLASCGVVVHQANLVTRYDLLEEKIRRVLARAPIPERGILVAHHNLGLLHMYDRPLALVSFPPANRATLELLESRFDVRAALLPEADIRRLTLDGLRGVGLRDVGGDSTLRFFREPDHTAPTPMTD